MTTYARRSHSKMLYIGGFSRSGSTLVGRVLGETPDAICIGETRYLLSRGVIDNVQCGCGQPFLSCPFWEAVGNAAFGGWHHVDVEHMLKIDNSINRFRALPFYVMPGLRSGFSDAVRHYTTWLTRLYNAISSVSGAKVIVETSKDPSFACLLVRINYDVRIAHLVRDSRAVAYSWTRKKQLPSPIGDQQYMPLFSPAGTAVRWLAWNTAFHALSVKHPSAYLRLDYESFVLDPRGILNQLSAFIGEHLALPDTQMKDTKVKLGDHHIFSGNPMRARTGWTRMQLDDEWREMLSPSQLGEVTAITWPLLRLYGYPTFPPARVPTAAAASDEH
jgi:sulfotransferase family protein